MPSDVAGSMAVSFSLLGVDTGATITNNGGNLIGTAGSPINPLLGPLANNGGPTLTHALLTDSPAIDAGNPTAAVGVGTVPLNDQRGAPFTRVFNGDGIGSARIDIGAFELQVQPLPPAFFGDYNQNGEVDAADYVMWRKTLGSNVANYSGADGDGDGTIDQDDYGVWRAHFGQTMGAGAGGELRVEGQESRARALAVFETTTDNPHPLDYSRPLSATADLRPAGEVVARQPPALPGVIGVARPELPAMGVAVAGTSRENHALRLRLRDVPHAAVSHDRALLAWLAARVGGPALREAATADFSELRCESGGGRFLTGVGEAIDLAFASIGDDGRRNLDVRH